MMSLFINGQWLAGEGPEFESLNPADATPVWCKASASAAQVTAAVAAARAAQPAWAALGFEPRLQILQAFAAQLQQQQEALAGTISLETGKPHWEALTEVSAMINKVDISIRACQQRTGNDQPGLQHHAHGVMAVFGPYNFPGHLPNGHIVPALLAGNTLVFKPSEETPLCAEKTAELWQAAGLPAGVLNLLQGGREVGEALAQQPIDGLLFTGSSNTGRLLHQQFGGRPEVLLALEMGGNNPLIVDGNVHAQHAAELIVRSAFISAGQRCTCARRLILTGTEAQTDAIVQALLAVCARLILQPKGDEQAFYGPLISARAQQQLLAAQQQLISLGGKALLSMSAIGGAGFLLSPGLIDMTGAQPAPDEEWFGPLLQLYRTTSFDDAIKLANNSRFGLAAGLISDDPQQQQQFRAQIRAGVISINAPTAGASSALPFGGIGASGNHRPSAFYAADYCAWPQAISTGPLTHDYVSPSGTGFRP